LFEVMLFEVMLFEVMANSRLSRNDFEHEIAFCHRQQDGQGLPVSSL